MNKTSIALCGLAWLGAIAAARAAGTLTVRTEASPDGFDIGQYESLVSNDAAGLTVYDQLLLFKGGSTEVVPRLVEKWSITADGLSYTLNLRRGVKFHSTSWFKPTRAFNADDVLFSINRINDKTHFAHGIAKNGYIYWEGMRLSALIRSVAKVDETTVRFALNRPEAPFPAELAMSATGSVYSAEYGEQLRKAGQLEQLNTQPVGTGPFVFKSYQRDAMIRFTANSAYWGGAPAIAAHSFDNDANVKMLRSSPLLTAYVGRRTPGTSS